MSTLTIPSSIKSVLTDLACELKTSESEVISRALSEFADKVKRKNRLLPLAGSFQAADADQMIKVIYQSRHDKANGVNLTQF